MNYLCWDQFIRFLHSWEGGGEISINDEGEECYTVQSDGGGGAAVGYGVDISTHRNTLINLGYDVSIGSKIPVTIVDNIEKEELKEKYDQVVAATAGLNLTEYQIYALLSRCYNYGVYGGLQQSSLFIYPSEEIFTEAYQNYYININNDDYFGDYRKTDFDNQLFTQYMTYLKYANGSYPSGWVYRRKAEWCLFQTGYYGYDLVASDRMDHGIDEYWSNTANATDFTNGINLYNNDGSVNENSINELNIWITEDLLNTKYHWRTYEMQNGPFAKWWDYDNNWFTAAGYKFQCTWYAYGRANQYLELYGTKYTSWPGTRGNANKWYDSGKKYFNVGNLPKQNSLVVWRDGSNAGHVAYVEAVDTVNRKVYISHAGGGKSWFGVQKYTYEEMKNLWGYDLLGYIYLDSPKE